MVRGAIQRESKQGKPSNVLEVKETIKNKLCLSDITPNYPLRDLVEWLDTLKISASALIHLLDEIQGELDKEAAPHSVSTLSPDSKNPMMKGYWCLYGAQVRSSYNAALRDPENKKRLWFLLQ